MKGRQGERGNRRERAYGGVDGRTGGERRRIKDRE